MAVDLSESVTYTLATNDFTAAGTVSPAIQGRIVCSGEGCPVATE